MKAILKVLRFSSLLHGYSAWGGEQNGSNSDFFLLLSLHTPPRIPGLCPHPWFSQGPSNSTPPCYAEQSSYVALLSMRGTQQWCCHCWNGRGHFSPVVAETSNARQYLSVRHSQPMFFWFTVVHRKVLVLASFLTFFSLQQQLLLLPFPRLLGLCRFSARWAWLPVSAPAAHPLSTPSGCRHAAGLKVGHLRPLSPPHPAPPAAVRGGSWCVEAQAPPSSCGAYVWGSQIPPWGCTPSPILLTCDNDPLPLFFPCPSALLPACPWITSYLRANRYL